MYDNEDEIKRKRRTLIYISVGLVVVIIIVLLMLLAGGSKKTPPTPKEKLSCELEVIRGTLGPDNIYNTEVEVGFKEIKPDKDITKKTVGEKDIPRNTSTYIINTEGTFKINGYVTNVTGETATCEISVSVKPTKPVCELEVKAGTLGTDGWYTSEIEVGFKIANPNNPNTKITKYYIKEYSELENEQNLLSNNDKYTVKEDSTVKVVGYVQDNNGAEGVCSIDLKKDATAPTCKLKVESGRKNDKGEYTDNPVIILESSADTSSGVLKSGVGIEKNYENEKYTVTKEGTTKVNGYVVDKAGNEGACSIEIKKEVKQVTPPPQKQSNPTCRLTVAGTKLADGSYNEKATVTLTVATTNGATITGKGIGLDNSYNNKTSYVVNSGTVTVRGVVKDSYGHSNSCSVQVKVTAARLLASAVQVGQKVLYNAGTWNSSANIPTTDGQFGGYNVGQSKNNGVKCFYQDGVSKNGWVVLAVAGGRVYLVHAGTPECYYHGYGKSSANAINKIATRANAYINTAYADSATILRCNDQGVSCSANTTLAADYHKTGTHYFLASSYSDKVLWGVSASGRISGFSDRAQGIRPIVALKADLKTSGQNANQEWVITPPARSGVPAIDSTSDEIIRIIYDLLYL